MDFVRRVRFENEVKANDDKEEEKNNIISTQELIEDARERRISKKTHFECTVCDYSSLSATISKKHEKFHQKDTVTHNCAECGKKFNTKYTLIRHKKSCHENIENKGDQCEEREESPEVPNQHKKSVHEIKQYQCDQCEFKETTKLNLRRHTESEHKGIKITKYILRHIKSEKMCGKVQQERNL